MSNSIALPFPYFADPNRGRPIFNGQIFVGLPDVDPEIPANQIPVSYIDENGDSIALAQPISTNSGGYPINSNGDIVSPRVGQSYSLKVLDRTGSQSFYVPNISSDVNQLQEELINGVIFKGSGDDGIVNGDIIPTGTDFVKNDGRLMMLSPKANGQVSSLSEYTANVDGQLVYLIPQYDLNEVYLSSFGYGDQGNSNQQNYAALERFYAWLSTQTSVGTIKHPPYEVSFSTQLTTGVTNFLGQDLNTIPSFIFDFNGGRMVDQSDVSTPNTQLVLFVVRNASVVSFLNADVKGNAPLPNTTRRGTTLCRAYDAEYASFEGKIEGMIGHLETRDCNFVKIHADCVQTRYPFLAFRCESFDVKLNNQRCWRDYFVQGANSGKFHISSEEPRQHSLLKSYNSEMNLNNIDGYYRVRNRPLDTIVTPTGQFAFEIESDEQAIFRNIDIVVDIEGNYERPIMMRNYKANGDDQDTALGHVFQNVKIRGRIRNTSGVMGNLFVVGGGYYSGDNIQNFSFEGLTVVGSFVINLAQLIPAIGSSNKMKWKDFTVTDAFLENHDQGFYAPYLRAENVNFPSKAYSSNNVQECGVLKFTKDYVGDIGSGIPIFNTDSTRTFNHVVVNYCATTSESTFNNLSEGRLSGLIVYPTSGSPAEFITNTEYNSAGISGTAEIYEVSSGVFGFRIPEWTTITNGLVQLDVTVNYSSYGEDDFSSIPGLVYEPYTLI